MNTVNGTLHAAITQLKKAPYSNRQSRISVYNNTSTVIQPQTMNCHANVCTIANELHSPIAKILHLLHTAKTSKEIFVFSYHIKNRLRYIHRETHAPHYTAVINLFADENFSFSAHIKTHTHTSFHLIAYLQQEPHLLLYSHIRVFHFSNDNGRLL